MKKAEKNEMDLLLRSLAPRKGSFPKNRMTDGGAQSAHLDADELSSYAAQTLPAPTRARYTIHLADCSQCRKIVAELAPAVSVGVRDHPEDQGATTFWQTVRHFFSLPVLRYAVPALGLFAIVAVGLVVFREQPRSDMVAKNEPTAGQVADTQPQSTEMPSQNKAGETSETQSVYDSAPLNAQKRAESNEQGQATGAGPGVASPAVAAKDSADKTTAAVAQPTFAPEPVAPPPAPKAQDQVAEVRRENTRTEAAARPQSAPAKEPGPSRDSYVRDGERPAEQERARVKSEQKEAQVAGTTASNTSPDRNTTAKLARGGALRTDVDSRKADDEAGETRSVAGRRFRRQGILWVDTAYQSGTSLTTVSRGSDQYRALVADEPSIRTVAEQLQGEVILIWKGRGYRIR